MRSQQGGKSAAFGQSTAVGGARTKKKVVRARESAGDVDESAGAPRGRASSVRSDGGPPVYQPNRGRVVPKRSDSGLG